MHKIELSNISKSFGKNLVLKNVNLAIEQGDFMTLLGPSGCGKTTLLRIIAGLEDPEEGIVKIDGQEVVNAQKKLYLPSCERHLNLVFQNYALWPHLNVFRNVAFGLEIAKKSKREIESSVQNALERMQILDLKDRYPYELSGGQQQRVAIARSIVTKPDILLMDEPLSNLDAKLRIEMRLELKRLHTELGCTIIYVTHDQAEAFTMSSRIGVFFKGQLIQVGRPEEIYKQPNDLRLVDFIGNPQMDLIPGVVRQNAESKIVKTPLGALAAPASAAEGQEVVAVLYPENLKLHSCPGTGRTSGTIQTVMPSGAETLLQVRVKDQSLLVREFGFCDRRPGEQIFVDLQLDRGKIYDRQTGRLLSRTDGPSQ